MSTATSVASNSWSVHAHHYAKHITSFTGKGAAALVAFAGRFSKFTPESIVLDEGAGTGALTQILVDMCPGITVTAVDFAPGMLRILDNKQLKNVNTKVVDASEDHEAQGLKPGSYTHVLSSFLIQFVDPGQKAVEEMYSMVAPGGLLGIATWEKVQIGEPWLIACKNLDPNYEFSSPFTSFNSTDSLEEAFQKVGCKNIQSLTHEIYWEAESPEQFVYFFMDLQNPAFAAMQDAWKGDREAVRAELLKVVKEKYSDLKFYMKAACTIGIK